MKKMPKAITFDQWAGSGGTRGIFAKGVRSGKIKLLMDGDEVSQ